VALVLVVTPGPAAAIDCTQGCAPTPLQVQSSQIQAKHLSVGVLNSTSQWQAAYLRGVVQSGGDEIYFYGYVAVPPNTVRLFGTTFDHPIQVLSCLTLCADPPHGPNEGPDPVGLGFEELQEAPKGGGGGSNP